MNASTSQGSPESWQPKSWSMRIAKLCLCVVFAIFLLNIGTLVLLSLGSGWSYPRLLPDRVDGAPWANLFRSRSGILRSSLVSLGISSVVASVSTILGLWTGVGLRRARSKVWLYIAYLPFVLSPVTVGLCLLDMSIRLGLASTYSGVIWAQSIFAYGFVTIFFCETWDVQIDKRVHLVRGLGGNSIDVWRHAILPRAWPLIVVAWTQAALFSWLDYGLVSVIGGGVIPSLTLSMFAYLREASVNQAAQSAMILFLPSLISFVIASFLLRSKWGKEV
jgi:putative spermidine/putrescine transport system permease protein